jgi:hypothetical protein
LDVTFTPFQPTETRLKVPTDFFFCLRKNVLEFGGVTLDTYQKVVNFRTLHAEVRMCGCSTEHRSDFVENVREYQLNFYVMFDDEMTQGQKSRRQKKN